MTDEMEINFEELSNDRVRNISGHERGVEARKKFKLDEFDALEDSVEVVVPNTIEAIATSFFQGMFSKSVQQFKSKDAFLEHYKFRASPSVMEQILRGIDRSLAARGGAAFKY
ncbi:hypothetical protein [Aliiroseovarius sp. F47248L]|uniref:hypothetical protein n=1 Tax=Aliiroseovarius sp. F47248L TaxID=2926420 RepID=UPI001FF4BD33|nr:hypothetical protein [Aliiroseovarius sp. F47248L]MCK0139308.1 hypothetical protein [Aliiroseovarius sp. F47248L]